jgi:hypothetical protein
MIQFWRVCWFTPPFKKCILFRVLEDVWRGAEVPQQAAACRVGWHEILHWTGCPDGAAVLQELDGRFFLS